MVEMISKDETNWGFSNGVSRDGRPKLNWKILKTLINLGLKSLMKQCVLSKIMGNKEK